MDLALTGKGAIVTGGSKGIGKAVALELAKEGVDVAICARDRGALKRAAAELAEETGRRIVPASDQDALRPVRTSRHHGKFDSPGHHPHRADRSPAR